VSESLVSCLMVTGGRPELVRRAVWCFLSQSYPNRELVILSDSACDEFELRPLEVMDSRIRVHMTSHDPNRRLGDLRNMTIDLARGEWLTQWDDDDWYGPDRIAVQLKAAMDEDKGASALKFTLMHLCTADGRTMSFRGDTGIATPGTILHRRTHVCYPNLGKNEDGEFLRAVRDELGLAVLGEEHSSSFVRVFHGSNTWDERHFLRRLRRTPKLWIQYQMAVNFRRDVREHPRFRLRPDEEATLRELDRYRWTVTTPPMVEEARAR